MDLSGPTRRGFLALAGSAVAALAALVARVRADAQAKRRPGSVAQPRVQYSIPGIATASGATFQSRLLGYAPGTVIWLLYGSDAPDPVTGYPAGALSGVSMSLRGRDGLVRHVVDDPAVLGDTQYYAALSTGPASAPSFIGDPIRFKTHPNRTNGFAMKIAVG